MHELFRGARAAIANLAALMVCAAARGAEPSPPTPVADGPEQTIVVSGRRLAVTTLVDRKVYDVTGDIQASFGAASDVLAVIPSVDIDLDGAISYRGDSNVLVLIDGKPSALLSGATAGDALRSIPARDIERIEVLSSPPAQFKAEGAAGVINIIMRSNRPEGIAGNLQASLGDSGRMFAGADASYRTGSMSVSLNAGFRQDVRQRKIESDVEVAENTSAGFVRETSTLRESASRQIPTASAKLEYELGKNQTLNASVGWLERGGLRTYTQRNTSVSAADVLASSERRSRGHDPQTELDQRLGYMKKFDREGEELEFSLHRSAARQRERYDYTNYSFVPAKPTYSNYLALLEDETDTEFAADYTLPLGDGQEFKLGYSRERTDFHFANRGATVDPATSQETPDASLTNNFRFRYLVDAAYGSYQTKGDFWTALFGLRAEHTDTYSLLITDRVSNRGSYFHVFPSLHLNRKLSESSTLSFAASRRIKRPDPDDLSPYVDREYTPDLRSGNPALRPQLTQSYEIGYGFEGNRSLQLTAYYRRNANSVTEVTRNLGDGYSLTSKTNLSKNDSAGLELSASGQLIPELRYTLSANPFHVQIAAKELAGTALKSTKGVNGKLKLDYRPTPEDSAQITIARTDKRLTPQGYVGATNIVNVGYKHSSTANLAIVSTLSDAFAGQRSVRVVDSPTESGTYVRAVKGRIIYVGVIYSFGSTPKDEQFEYDQ